MSENRIKSTPFAASDNSVSPQMAQWKNRIEQVLSDTLPTENTEPQRLHQAMRYSTLSGGKRIRAMMVYATGYLLDANDDQLDMPACAIEAMQCFSLIHDDLPALDDDDIRRGKPSCHCAFDEATAILAGDALQMFAFEQLCNGPHSAEQKVAMTRILAEDCGAAGMIGGGSIELEVSGKPLSLEEMKDLHWRKCGALIHASVMLGAYGAGIPDQKMLDKLNTYAYCVGVGYQISNDLLDGMGHFEMLGKRPNSDQSVGRTTFLNSFEPELSRARMMVLFDQALNAIDGLERSEPLREIVESVMKRTNSVFLAENR